MAIHVQHWDAFTKQPGKGNPAGIVLPAQNLSDAKMQSIATTIGFNDTAFLLPSQKADFGIGYFSPRREVSLCGHATIAAFAALHHHHLLRHHKSSQEYTIETKAGVLKIGIELSDDGDPLVVMNQCVSQFAPFSGSREMLAKALGIAVSDFHSTLPTIYGSTGRWTLVVPVADLTVMQKMHPSPGEFASVLTDIPDASIHPFCLETIDPRAVMHARHFSALESGTVEDIVTGTASGVLGAYHSSFVTGIIEPLKPLIVEQGYEVGREGIVQVWATREGAGCAVRIAGTACFVREIVIE